jgi:hypothetical protein
MYRTIRGLTPEVETVFQSYADGPDQLKGPRPTQIIKKVIKIYIWEFSLTSINAGNGSCELLRHYKYHHHKKRSLALSSLHVFMFAPICCYD